MWGWYNIETSGFVVLLPFCVVMFWCYVVMIVIRI